MNQTKTIKVAIFSGTFALLIGLVAFTINWNVYGGGMPGYNIFLFPGNLSLVYVWHPLFTEEIDFWNKLVLHSLGQFSFVAFLAAIISSGVKRVLRARYP